MIPPPSSPNADQLATAVASVVGTGAAAPGRAPSTSGCGTASTCACFPTVASTSARRGSAERRSRGSRRRASRAPPQPEDLVDGSWFDAWGGGLVTTCGLSNVGAASEGHGLHGTYTRTSAADLAVERTTSEVTATGTVATHRSRSPAGSCTSVGQGLVRLDDRVVNESEWTAAAPLLYHVNIGAPLWDDDAFLETDAHEVVPRDEAAAAGLATWDEPPPPDSGCRRAGLRARRRVVGAADESALAASS